MHLPAGKRAEADGRANLPEARVDESARMNAFASRETYSAGQMSESARSDGRLIRKESLGKRNAERYAARGNYSTI